MAVQQGALRIRAARNVMGFPADWPPSLALIAERNAARARASADSPLNQKYFTGVGDTFSQLAQRVGLEGDASAVGLAVKRTDDADYVSPVFGLRQPPPPPPPAAGAGAAAAAAASPAPAAPAAASGAAAAPAAAPAAKPASTLSAHKPKKANK
jgi:hypothetical protein